MGRRRRGEEKRRRGEARGTVVDSTPLPITHSLTHTHYCCVMYTCTRRVAVLCACDMVLSPTRPAAHSSSSLSLRAAVKRIPHTQQSTTQQHTLTDAHEAQLAMYDVMVRKQCVGRGKKSRRRKKERDRERESSFVVVEWSAVQSTRACPCVDNTHSLSHSLLHTQLLDSSPIPLSSDGSIGVFFPLLDTARRLDPTRLPSSTLHLHATDTSAAPRLRLLLSLTRRHAAHTAMASLHTAGGRHTAAAANAQCTRAGRLDALSFRCYFNFLLILLSSSSPSPPRIRHRRSLSSPPSRLVRCHLLRAALVTRSVVRQLGGKGNERNLLLLLFLLFLFIRCSTSTSSPHPRVDSHAGRTRIAIAGNSSGTTNARTSERNEGGEG